MCYCRDRRELCLFRGKVKRDDDDDDDDAACSFCGRVCWMDGWMGFISLFDYELFYLRIKIKNYVR